VVPQFRSFAEAELRHLYEGLIAGPATKWVNPLETSHLAERKVYQLRTAGVHGLAIPATIVANSHATLQEFADGGDRIITKPISQGLVANGGEWFAVHTREVRRADLNEAGAMAAVPILLQQRIRRGMDIRLTIIGRDAYAVEVVTPSAAPVDWRAVSDGLIYRPCTIPRHVDIACRAMMASLSLAYGAFDFIRTDDGTWVFLEVNPVGEWAWLETELGLPMRASFVDLFYGASGDRCGQP
jgi:glutathione synthase/RimK-type ligase-like ATP-grasp enzyme